MGMLGPRRVLMNDDGTPLPPPYRLVDNEYSLLDVTDLVFIDPVMTGYSRPAPGQDPKQFHGITEDTQSVADFIRLYVTRARRWASPKFLAGESYGTTRSAALSGHLQQHHGIYLNGIILISTILNFQTAGFAPGNDLPYALFLPTYTATAWYHKRLPKDLQGELKKALAESERFAAGEYTLALMKGDAISAEERATVTRNLARLTGLSPDYIERANLRIHIRRFDKELLRDQRRTVGRFDSRIKGIDSDAAGDAPEYDPSYPIVQGPYTAMFNQYVRGDLKFESDLPYEILTGRVRPWNYGQFQNRYVNVAETLRGAMTQNPALKVFVANGYYDLATPYFATEYTFNHLGLDPTLRTHVSMSYYEAGHMMYTHKPSLVKLKEDMAAFLRSALK
jgi:carboxypeptidase C (cathepsin A)